jgi:integrase
MATFEFKARSIPSAPEEGKVQTDYWDGSLPGFGMRVSSGGTRSWFVMYRYNGINRRMKLGNYPLMKLADARDAARAALRKAEDGQDPASESKRVKVRMDTVEDLAKLYIEQHAKPKKRSWKKDDQILNREVLPLIGRKRVVDVKRQDVRDVLQPIIDRGALIRANHTLEVVRMMFNWAIQEKDMAILNPAAGIKKPGEVNDRRRYLTDMEFYQFWKALTLDRLGQHGVAAFQLLALTMQREMEVLRMRWQDIDWNDATWTIPADHAKNQLEHVVPLGEFAIGCLLNLEALAADGDVYVFQSDVLANDHVRRVFLEKRIIKIREAAKLINVTIHDLRRSGTTYLGRLKVPQLIKKKILNHTARKKGDVTDIYDRFEYLDEKREAMQKWETFLLNMAGVKWDDDAEPTSNVVPLARVAS